MKPELRLRRAIALTVQDLAGRVRFARSSGSDVAYPASSGSMLRANGNSSSRRGPLKGLIPIVSALEYRVMADAAICDAETMTARSSRIVLKVSSDSLPSPKMAQYHVQTCVFLSSLLLQHWPQHAFKLRGLTYEAEVGGMGAIDGTLAVVA